MQRSLYERFASSFEGNSQFHDWGKRVYNWSRKLFNGESSEPNKNFSFCKKDRLRWNSSPFSSKNDGLYEIRYSRCIHFSGQKFLLCNAIYKLTDKRTTLISNIKQHFFRDHSYILQHDVSEREEIFNSKIQNENIISSRNLKDESLVLAEEMAIHHQPLTDGIFIRNTSVKMLQAVAHKYHVVEILRNDVFRRKCA